ncbi:protein-export membrane protein SecF [candidate division TM6 bacterium RIFCSPHIGHO2_12_FULL_38_8]|nr:MAG: protein-export membrane protein SecF [candidate division TM6 bacterium RIFCSPHIGHO2_12_FULL_38_8]
MYKYNFLKYGVPSVLFTMIIIGAGIVGYVMKGGFRYSVDFVGGTEMRVRFEKPVDTQAVRKVIHEEWQGTVHSVIGALELMVRVPQTPDKVSDLDKKLMTAINQVSIDNPGKALQINSISRTISDNLWSKWLKVILLSLILLVLYLSFSFKFAFALGAVIALAHDALIVLACFVLMDKEISIDFIGAIMAVLGYSINDTIIVFSRIRHNMKKMHGQSMYDIVNLSINERLRRTILTSFATALVVASLFVFGGDSLRDFSLVILLGIVFGTFSSIYIASPIMMLFMKKNA